MEIEKTVFPLSRYWYNGGFRFYYAYGNTPAQDFLQNCTGNLVREPEVLVLGCGDIRSCFYSLWKNFDVNASSRFDGVHFVMNDISAAVVARDILFLYLCLQIPEDDRDIRKWLSGMWAIWFCHELYPEHNNLLSDSLRMLCKYSESWSSNYNPLHPLVKFSSPSTFKQVKSMWKLWLERGVDIKSVKAMQSSRQKELEVRGWLHNSEEHASGFVEGSTEIPFETKHNSKKRNAQKSEVRAFLKSGNVYAENVLGLNDPSGKTFVNITFFERENGQYNLHYRSLPFTCFYQTVDFSKKQLQSASHFKVSVNNRCFTSLPLLANSVQQFSLWLLSSQKVLSCDNHKAKISFTFDCSHALTFCYELENNKKAYPLHKFDLVYTSNLMDHLGPPNLVLSIVPLLKESGLLLTTTLYKKAFLTVDRYLTSSFGFDCKLFPVILGIRCINHEGGSYSSPVTVKPCPVTVKGGDFFYHEDFLIWERVEPTAIPLVFSPGQQLETSVVTSALLKSVQVAVFSLLRTPKVPQMMTNLCVETAVKVLQVFMLNACADFNPQFWKPLSDLLKKSIQPYLCSMQTQLFLHGIHMHLTVTEANCSMCLQVPISSHISLFSIQFFLPEAFPSPKFIAIVHKEMRDNAEYLCDIALRNGDVHVFDCVSPSSGSDNSILLYFYAPLSLVKAKYKVTIASFFFANMKNIPFNTFLPTQPLSGLLVSESLNSFKFFQPIKKQPLDVNLESFGSISSSTSDGDTSDIVIDLSETALSSSTVDKLQPKRLSSSEITLSYGKCMCHLKYPYPISYTNMKIKVKKSSKKFFIQCPRAYQQFEEEKALFVISPDRELSLVPFSLSEEALSSLSGQQFTKRERDIMESCSHSISQMPPFLNAKKSFLFFFQTDAPSYHFVLPGNVVHGLVLVNKRFFDYENKVPVVDLAFCFLEVSFTEFVEHHWKNISPMPVCNVEVDYEQYEMMKEIFYYFARRTCGTCSTITDSSCRLSMLSKEGIQKHFTRAVISLLLCDPDHYMHTVILAEDKLSSKKIECSNCGELCETTPTCSNCRHSSVHSKPTAISKDSDSSFQPFPLGRYWYDGDFRYYYAYGNTPAEDFLQNCIGVTEPTVLSLGCGDIRSCFYTLWKNCDSTISRGPKRFEGVHFVLNDCSTSVQARNIVFMYLCLQLPKNKDEKKKWLSAMWAIWYCHELYPQHQKVLDDSLKLLLKFSDSFDQWESSENPLQKFIKFTSPTTLFEISQVWKSWLERKIAVTSVDHMHLCRVKELTRRGVLEKVDLYAFSYSHKSIFIIGDTDSDMKKVKAREPEISAYIKYGNCYAEKVLNIKLMSSPTSPNLTFYEGSDGVYTLHYGSVPFKGYCHTLEFSPDDLRSLVINKSLCDSMLVQSKSFKSHPFLANSVQQFTMWVQSASNVLNKGDFHASFTFNNQHMVSLCQELQSEGGCDQYDLIYTSNLMDHLGPPTVILSTMPLLKPDGLLFATTLLYKRFANTVEEYLSMCFGFDCKFLPVLLGSRCIDYEGPDYSSPVIIQPTPVDIGDIIKTAQYDRTLVWEKVSAQSFTIPQLPAMESGSVTDALFDSVKVAAYSLLTAYADGQCILNNNCIETAIAVLQTFSSSVNSDTKDYKFWFPLSSSLVHKIQPFLHGLQTQAILHNLHMHLTVNEDNCPMCRQSPIEEHIGLFCAKVSLPINNLTPHFMTIIHHYPSSDAQYLCNEAKSGNKDVHIIDCIDGIVEDKTLNLKFYAPLMFVKGNYKVTIVSTEMRSINDIVVKNIITTIVPTTNIRPMQIKFSLYNFSQFQNTYSHQLTSENAVFGKLVYLIYDGNKARLEIALSDFTLETLSVHKLKTSKVSPCEIKLMCGELKFSLRFKYPIAYDKISIKLSIAQKNIKIISPRQAHQFEQEKPILITIPDHQLSLPPQILKDEILMCHSGIQMNKMERQLSDSCNRNYAMMTPIMNVKESFMIFSSAKMRFIFV